MITQSTAQFRCVAARQLFALLRAVASRLQLILMRRVSYRNKRLDWIQSLSLDSGKTRPLVFPLSRPLHVPVAALTDVGGFRAFIELGRVLCAVFFLVGRSVRRFRSQGFNQELFSTTATDT